MLHEIRVNGYAAEADGPLDLGTWGSYGTEQLHFTFDAAWDDLTKSVTFSTDGYTGEAVTLLLPESGRVEVPQQATAAQTVCGRITVLGTCAGVQRISADLPYQTRNHSAVPGQAPHSLPSAFEEISTAAEQACSRAQNAEDAAALAQTSAQVAQAAAQDAVRVAASAQKIARSVRDDADAGAFQGEKLTYADLTEQDKADLRRPALEAAATANEAVAGLRQTLLRYGVQVGQIGEIVLFADGTLHPNHLWADGSEIDPAAYPELAAFAAQAAEHIAGMETAPAPVQVRGEFPAPYYTPLGTDGKPAVFLKAKPKTREDLCTKCGLCVRSCPMGSISAEDPSLVQGICIKCQACVKKCPVGAKYFDDPAFLSHVAMLEQNYTRPTELETFFA